MWTAERPVAVDLFGPDFVADPAPELRRLRERHPVHHDPRTGLWLVSRYADVRAVLTDQDTYRPDNALTAVTPMPIPVLRVLARYRFALPPTLANNGTESHAGLRALVARFVSPARVADAVPLVRRLVAERVAALDPGARTEDLHTGVARDVPALVLLHLLGIADVDLPVLKAWSVDSLELFWGNPDLDRQRELAHRAGEFHRWLAGRLAEADPGEADLFGALRAHRVPAGRALTIDEAAGLCYFLLIAGQETTTQLLDTVFTTVLRHPDLWRRVAAGEPGLAAACVEEVLRREPPVVTWRRVTARPVTLAGVDLPAGAQLLLMLAGTGSDPAVFDTPDEFRPGRPRPRQHLAFGHGRHFCLGAGLARMEAATALEVVARAFPALALATDEPPPMLGLLSFRAPLRVPVRLG